MCTIFYDAITNFILLITSFISYFHEYYYNIYYSNLLVDHPFNQQDSLRPDHLANQLDNHRGNLQPTPHHSLQCVPLDNHQNSRLLSLLDLHRVNHLDNHLDNPQDSHRGNLPCLQQDNQQFNQRTSRRDNPP